MAITNHERVGKVLDLLKTGVSPFVEREFKAKYGDSWAANVRDVLSDTRLGAGKGELLNDIASIAGGHGRNVGFRRWRITSGLAGYSPSIRERFRIISPLTKEILSP